MGKEATERVNVAEVAKAIGVSVDEVQRAWQDLQRRGLVSTGGHTVTISPLAMRRATSDIQRRLAAHLAGYLLTENAFIVRQG
jgi:transposase-like protein